MKNSADLFEQYPNDQKLIALVQQGDRHAFDQLVQKYQLRILKLVMRYVNDPSDALDIAQDSFLKAYRALDKFRGDSAFYTWLYRIAINTAKNHALSQNKRIIETDIELIDADYSLIRNNYKDYTAPEKLLLDSEINQAMQEAIGQLPKELRMAIILRELDGMSYEEIATIMDCPLGTVRSRIFRAREAIEQKIRPLLND